MKYLAFTILIILIALQSCKKESGQVDGEQLAVWNEDTHNAFTDLITFQGYYYCAFRVASDHNSFDGKTRIIKSVDGKNWNAVALLSIQNRDMRDVHFFIDNNNVLSVSINSRDKFYARQNSIFKLQDEDFRQSNNINEDDDYLFSGFAKLKDTVYAIGFNEKQICFSSANSKKPKIMLFSNMDAACTNFGILDINKNWIDHNFKCPCEPSLVFTSDSTAVAIVRDEHTPGSSHIGSAKYPFTDWKWQVFPYFVRGPKLALLPNGKIFLAAGSIEDYDKTYYAILNPNDFSVEKIRFFPSNGDTGYPGVIIEGSTALVSYYSSHEGNARIYIDRIVY